MINIELEQVILQKILDKNNKISGIKLNKLSNYELEYLNNRYCDSTSIRETIYRLKNNIEIRPKCPICGKPIIFIGKEKYPWTKTCLDKSCSYKLSRLNSKQTCIKKYGVEYTTQTTIQKEKSKQTKLQRYGHEYWSNPEKTSKTWQLKTEEEKQQRTNKTRETCLSKYGILNGGCTEESLNKIKHHNIEKYGVEYYFNSDDYKTKTKETCLEKYGVDKYQKTDEFKYLMSQKISSEECLEKRKQTNFERYFSYTYNNPEKHKYTCLTYYNVPYYNNQEKRIETMRKNGTFNKSKSEDELYIILKKRYPDIIRQYRDNRYPFNCDFYIPSKDLFIEFNGSQYHQDHPFDKNNTDDIKILEELKEKANKSNRHKEGKLSQYDTMIYVWTDLDVRKRNIAKENKLNFIEIWRVEEINNFV